MRSAGKLGRAEHEGGGEQGGVFAGRPAGNVAARYQPVEHGLRFRDESIDLNVANIDQRIVGLRSEPHDDSFPYEPMSIPARASLRASAVKISANAAWAAFPESPRRSTSSATMRASLASVCAWFD